MTPERGIVYLWAVDFIFIFSLFIFSGEWLILMLAIIALLLFYAAVRWEFERQQFALVIHDAVAYGVGCSIDGEHIPYDKLYMSEEELINSLAESYGEHVRH